MSKVAEIEKKFDIQVDYVKCEECGDELEFELESDSCGDLQITVGKCNCGDSQEDKLHQD